MQDGRSHSLLAQIPLTVSPFISLPTATTLPYTYKTLPSTLPKSSIGDASSGEKAQYVVSPSGKAAHPDEILGLCQTLQSHLKRLQDDADKTLKDWDSQIRERDLAEKRRIAPGWLDREERILQPERKPGQAHPPNDANSNTIPTGNPSPAAEKDVAINKEGEDIDRAFGVLDIK